MTPHELTGLVIADTKLRIAAKQTQGALAYLSGAYGADARVNATLALTDLNRALTKLEAIWQRELRLMAQAIAEAHHRKQQAYHGAPGTSSTASLHPTGTAQTTTP